jgi:hypothetical protein
MERRENKPHPLLSRQLQLYLYTDSISNLFPHFGHISITTFQRANYKTSPHDNGRTMKIIVFEKEHKIRQQAQHDKKHQFLKQEEPNVTKGLAFWGQCYLFKVPPILQRGEVWLWCGLP